MVSAILTTLMKWCATPGASQQMGGVIVGLLGSARSLSGGWFAYWLTGIIAQARKRRVLIEQLETTRRDLAASSSRPGAWPSASASPGEIHDTLAQGFVSIVLHLEAAEAALDRQPLAEADALRGHLDDAHRVAHGNLARRGGWSGRCGPSCWRK
ncbi:MAG: histidine kinase dimerization/phosphoacceptor domain-containing protein [Thermomicrobiales bacterium]